MKVLKETGTYLEGKGKNRRNASLLSLGIGVGAVVYSFTFEIFIVAFLLLPALGFSLFFFKSYLNYRGGAQAEKKVTETLMALGDDYSLINDVMLPGNYGNVDHIVLGPNGIFAIETKNYSGKIICRGDEWIRHYPAGWQVSMRGRPYWKDEQNYSLGSPSRQVKRNAVKIKEIITSSKSMWIEGVVVFTNSDADLQLEYPTVPVLTLDELYDYIRNYTPQAEFSQKELKSVGETILKAGKL